MTDAQRESSYRQERRTALRGGSALYIIGISTEFSFLEEILRPMPLVGNV